MTWKAGSLGACMNVVREVAYVLLAFCKGIEHAYAFPHIPR